jgi:hypothetical protein
MYVVEYTDGKIIAWHEKKKVVKQFVSDQASDKDYIRIVKIDEDEFDMDKYIDLYLYRIGDQYIQDKYLECIEVFGDSIVHDLKLTRDVLSRLYVNTKNKKDAKALDRVMLIVENEIEKINDSTPLTNKELEEMYFNYEMMKTNSHKY